VVASMQMPSREIVLAVKQQQELRTKLLSSSETPDVEPPKWSAPHSQVEPSVRFIVV
jgi:hypothetical protein